MLTAGCRRGNMFFYLAPVKKVRYRCSATVPMVMLDESYNKKHKVRYKPTAL
nr:truncated ORF13a [synthetic construct]